MTADESAKDDERASGDGGLDDPRLTAHAMGEAFGSLAPEEQVEVDAIRATADALRAGFAATPMPVLDPAHRAAVLQGLSGSESGRSGSDQGLSPEPAQSGRGAVPGSVVRLSEYSGLGALAATLLLVVGLGIAGATGFGSRDGSGLYVKSFSAPNYAGTYLDENRQFRLTNQNADGTWDVASSDGRFNIKSVDIPNDVTVTLTGTLPGDLRSFIGTTTAGPFVAVGGNGAGSPQGGMGFGGGGAGASRSAFSHRRSIAGRDSEIRAKSLELSSQETNKNNTIADLRRQLSDVEAARVAKAAKGPEGAAVVAALTYERNMLRAELDRATGTVKRLKDKTRPGAAPHESDGAGGASDQNMELVINLQGSGGGGFNLPSTGIQGFMNLDELESGSGLPFNSGQGGFEEWVLNKDGDGADDATSTFSHPVFVENPWIRPYGESALSTFSIDVDTAGYSIVRRSLMEQNQLPAPGALRVEELVNYFPYAYEGPVSADPFAVHVDAAACPWAPGHRLVRIALKGREVEEAVRPAANLVFLLDVSGSMNQPNKLPLVKRSIELLTERLTARDRVAMVVYAGNSGLVLPSTAAGDHAAILAALGRLEAGGSTNGGAGIELAYKVAAENFVQGGINRVVLATDGDFNVGVSDPSALVKMVEEKAKSGVFLTALGYGYDNLKDSTLEQLADKGNGNYGYVDTLGEARKVLVEQGMSTLHCIAKDVKIQVEFNPAKVAGYRLLGYENRMLAAQDFADDQKDAGEIGAGHTVTALYEVVPAGVEVPGAAVDELRYQRPGAFAGNAETLVVKLRWKEPEGEVSTPREFPFVDAGLSFDSASVDFRFAAAVAAFGMVLRDSREAGSAHLDLVREIAVGSLGADAGGWRAEFITLVEKAKALRK